MTNKRKPKKAVEPRYREGGSVQVLANQLDTANEKASRYKAERNAWAARAGAQIRLGRPVNYPGRKDTQTLLERVAAALLLADLCSHPGTGDNLSDGPGRIGGSKNHPIPGASVKLPRFHASRLRSAIFAAVEQFEFAAEHHFDPPRPKDEVPKVRCFNRDCAAYDIHFAAWRTIRGGRTLPYERCSSCGNPVAAPTAIDTRVS